MTQIPELRLLDDPIYAMSEDELAAEIDRCRIPGWWPGADDLPPRTARIELCACKRLFEWADGSLLEAAKPGFGIRAAWLPVRDADGVTEDFVAWDRAAPHEWWVRADSCRWLGLDYAAFARWSLEDGPAIDIFETPAQFVAAGGRGLVVLDWQLQPIDLAVLDGFGKLRVASRALGERLAAAQTPRWEMVVARPGRPATPVPAHAG